LKNTSFDVLPIRSASAIFVEMLAVFFQKMFAALKNLLYCIAFFKDM